MKDKTSKMTVRMKAFCDYYLELGNATEAARKSGYSEKTANRIATENLSKPVIKEYLEKRLKEIDSKRIAKPKEIMEFFSSVMRGEVKDVLDFDPSLDTRIKAAENLAKRFGVNKTETEELLRMKLLELEIEKKQLEIEKIKNPEKEDKDDKSLSALDKLEEILMEEIGEGNNEQNG